MATNDVYLRPDAGDGANGVRLRPDGPSGGVNYVLSCSAGAYAYTGIAATLSLSRNLQLSKGIYAYTGQTANLTIARNISLSTGVYAYVGLPSILTYVPGSSAVNYTLALEPGIYAYQGNDATLIYEPGVVNYDTHDGGDEKKRVDSFRKKKELLREQLNESIDAAHEVQMPVEVEKVQQAIPVALTKEDIAEVTSEVNLLITQIYMRIAMEKAARQDEDDVAIVMLMNG